MFKKFDDYLAANSEKVTNRVIFLLLMCVSTLAVTGIVALPFFIIHALEK